MSAPASRRTFKHCAREELFSVTSSMQHRMSGEFLNLSNSFTYSLSAMSTVALIRLISYCERESPDAFTLRLFSSSRSEEGSTTEGGIYPWLKKLAALYLLPPGR